MKDLGFQIHPIKWYTMGQLATDEMMWSYGGAYSKNLKTWEAFENYLQNHDEGLYLVGLSSEYMGHVLFLRYSVGEKPVFYHSGIGLDGIKIQVNPAKEYILEFFKPHVIHAAKIDRTMIRKWLTETPILPVKCKTYRTERERLEGVVLRVQKYLKQLGLYSGQIDGLFGLTTRTAIGLFQKSYDLPITYLPGDATVKHLIQATSGFDT